MKVKTQAAASSLGIHPSHLLLRVAQLDSSLTFDDVWPEIEEGLVATVSVSGGHKIFHHQKQDVEKGKTIAPAMTHGLSSNALRVIDKLWRQSKWGDVCVSFDALVNITHLASSDLQEAVSELRKRRLLDHDGTGRSAVSLDPGKRKEVDSIVQPYTQRGLPSNHTQ